MLPCYLACARYARRSALCPAGIRAFAPGYVPDLRSAHIRRAMSIWGNSQSQSSPITVLTRKPYTVNSNKSSIHLRL